MDIETGKQGTAITFVTPGEQRKIGFIKRIAKADIKRRDVPRIADIRLDPAVMVTVTLALLAAATAIALVANALASRGSVT